MALPFQHLWRRLWQDPPPTLACEFSEDGIAVAGWSIGATQPDSFAMRPLPPGALRPSPVRENINAPQEVAAAVAAAIQEVTRHTRSRRREIALLLPDTSARVTVLQFDEMPSNPED